MSSETETIEGVREAWDFYLSQHPITVPQAIEDGIARAAQDRLDDVIMRAVELWLGSHAQEIYAAIAARKDLG